MDHGMDGVGSNRHTRDAGEISSVLSTRTEKERRATATAAVAARERSYGEPELDGRAVAGQVK